MAIEAIRVLSEDRNLNRRTRLQFCEDGAAKALGRALQDDIAKLSAASKSNSADEDVKDVAQKLSRVIEDVFVEVHAALCGLANILEPIEDPLTLAAPDLEHEEAAFFERERILGNGCIQTCESGGLVSLLRGSTICLNLPKLLESSTNETATRGKILLRETCRTLTSLSPLLLCGESADNGYARFAGYVLDAFHEILDVGLADGVEVLGAREELSSVLFGLDALATSEPLKIRIVDKTLSPILQLKNAQEDRNDVANIAGQVFLSLGFSEDELAVQVAGSNPNFLAEWFCLQRSLTLQAMVRAELRKILLAIWKRPYDNVVQQRPRPPLVSIPVDDTLSPAGKVAREFADVEIFENFADDDDNMEDRDIMVQQYKDVCDCEIQSGTSGFVDDEFQSTPREFHLLTDQVYPFNDPQAEIDWILNHHRSCYLPSSTEPSSMCTTISLPEHVEVFLETCFPSKLLRNHILPVFTFRPDASFNFRAIMMPQKKYFSFRREGQMVARLCDTEPETLAFEDVHWTLGFNNSTFAGEFSESLVQALYLCSTIRSLSFARDPGLVSSDRQSENEGEETVALSKLVGFLPPWIDFLTFKNIFNDKELRSFVENLDKMGQLSADHDIAPTDETTSRGKGQFWSISITHCQKVGSPAWQSFFSLLGRSQTIKNAATTTPLSSLMILDLSYNGLGDGVCAMLLDIVHDPKSGCRLAQLDLSGNPIRKGVKVVNSLRKYIDTHRYIPIMNRHAWGSSLHTLNLSSCGLGVGCAEVEILSMLKYNALGLKVLDLSDNNLSHATDDYQYCHVLVSSLSRNTILRHLNLSKNKYSSRVVEDILDRLGDVKNELCLTFLGFEENTPPITSSQRRILENVLVASRTQELKKLEEEMPLIEEIKFDDEWIKELKVDDADEISALKKNLSPKTPMVGQGTSLASVPGQSDGGPRGDNMITVLFSAPLVFHDDRRQLRPFKKLDFDMERELMWQCMKEASRDIELSFDNATHDRLLAAMTKRCSCLHYSGHGHQIALPFEDGQGGPNWFKVEDIKSLIARGEGAAPFKFVFVSACHSGLAGETFASAGVPHVVCCQQQFELKDTAALAFTRQFYLSLAIGHTVKESFDQGCKAVRATPNLRDADAEMKKFMLLPKDGNHDVPIFNAVSIPDWPKMQGGRRSVRGSLRKSKVNTRQRSMYGAGMAGTKQSELGVRNMMQEDPSPTPPQFFCGREVEMYYILKAILGKRLVSVVGETGVGRSSIVCAVCHYVNERASTIIGIEKIIFVKAKKGRKGDCCRSLIEQVQRKLGEAGKGRPPRSGADMEDMFEYICNQLKNEKVLLVFDRMEHLENSDDAQEFPMFLSSLFRGTKNVKVLLTNRQQLGIPSVGGQVEYAFPMGPLNFENTVRLFANLCPHMHTEGQRYKLYQQFVKDYLQADLRPHVQGLDDRTRSIFSALGDGIPSRIEKAAYDITPERLQSLIKI